ncbi:M56 family metallopeptidase [Negativibacillus massiliensis]|uniref:M56 family metallopeptidase n=1 Tax=Negativibacillus massiliensis TaxID=1871035 RepID=UPI0023F8F0AF|nr:M56 family metallopeptidase [Negativibacillus massiliensis]
MSLVQMSLSAALMIVAIIILRALTIERFPKKTFLVLWWIALLRLLIPFSIPSVMSFYSWFDPNLPAVVEQSSAMESTFEPVLDDSSETMENSTQFEMTPIPDTDIEYVEVKPSKSFSENFFDMLPAIWGVGIGVIAAFFGINYWKGIREFRMSLPVENEFVNEWLSSHQLRRNITIRQYDCIHTPLTYGIFRPVILLPKESLEQSPSTLNFILTHEWVHIRRFDCVTKILLTATLCIHWMNPLVWVMYLLFNRDIELSCDETVLHLLGRNRRSDYALALIDMEEQKGGFASFASGFGRNAIEERIRAIMKMKKASLITILAAVVVVACVSILFATSAKNNPIDTELPSSESETVSDKILTDDDQTKQEVSVKTSKKTFSPAERFAELEKYGVMFVPSETDSTKGDLYYNGELVKFFTDPNPNGDFSFYSETEGSNLSLYITYHNDGTMDKLNTTTEDIIRLYPEEPLLVNECEDLQEYFDSFGPHRFIFRPSADDSNKGNLYLDNGELVSTFYDYREPDIFQFHSQDADNKLSLVYDGNSCWELNIPIQPISLFSFKNEGVVYDREKLIWTFHGKTIRWFIDGDFAFSVHPDGEIGVRATYQDNIRQSVEELTVEESEKIAYHLLKPDSFTPPVKEASQVKDINSQRIYYAPEGTEVTCSVSGKVMYVGTQNSSGYCVKIYDQKGITWTYSHLKEISVKYGQNVSVGDKIGTVGHSGSATDFYLGLDAVSKEEMLDISQLLAE